jgi:hypothetical protein
LQEAFDLDRLFLNESSSCSTSISDANESDSEEENDLIQENEQIDIDSSSKETTSSPTLVQPSKIAKLDESLVDATNELSLSNSDDNCRNDDNGL